VGLHAELGAIHALLQVDVPERVEELDGDVEFLGQKGVEVGSRTSRR